MKIKFLISIFIIMVMQGHAFARNCDANDKKTGYVQSIYIGVDNENDGSVTFNFLPKGSKEAITLSFYNYISSKQNTIFPDDMVAAQNARAAYTLLLTAYSSGSPIKIMRCYGNGVVALGMGHGSL
ncbi:hypothetical protein Xvie_03588 [Xenorhabdus vietnamensis]|uniref:Uncharacterized protein n=1 Tax=Xenorhabdus vietnamensis TaxID=351656 RepID=A0A1Y2SA22_9GAMM|nr:hypothetical protein [Xenorhabdus vietnamensis]OTA14559.1 hypothetical protein Xvie_03588 [Xenorhabdus vietnamensis]